MLTMPNLDAMGHRWVGALASFWFKLEYQKGTGNGATDALSWVPISHSRETIQSLLEGVIVGVADRGKAKASEELLEGHEHLSQKARVQAAKLEPMHIVDWEEAQEADATLAGCRKWLYLRKDTLLPQQDTFLKECLGVEAETEQSKMFFRIHNSLVLSKGLMYVSTTPKGKMEGVLAFVIPVGQCHLVLNGVHHDASHQGQQRTLALAQEKFWWPMMAERLPCDSEGMSALPSIQGSGALGSPLSNLSICSVGVGAPRLHQYRVHDGAEQAPHGEEHPRDDGSFHEVHPHGGDKGPDCQDCRKGVLRALHSSFWGACKFAER